MKSVNVLQPQNQKENYDKDNPMWTIHYLQGYKMVFNYQNQSYRVKRLHTLHAVLIE